MCNYIFALFKIPHTVFWPVFFPEFIIPWPISSDPISFWYLNTEKNNSTEWYGCFWGMDYFTLQLAEKHLYLVSVNSRVQRKHSVVWFTAQATFLFILRMDNSSGQLVPLLWIYNKGRTPLGLFDLKGCLLIS